MSQLLMDTSAYSRFKRNDPAAVEAVQQAGRVCMSPVVVGELRSGFAGGNSEERNEQQLKEFLRRPRVTTVLIDDDTSVFYATIHDALRKLGKPIPSNDVWIAASAMQHGLIVLTADAHYQRIPQIIVKLIR